jgi:hypothetical protein
MFYAGKMVCREDEHEKIISKDTENDIWRQMGTKNEKSPSG